MYCYSARPQLLTKLELDAYLEKGWFRLGQMVFTTNFLKFSHELYSAYWLRIDLKQYEATKTQAKLLKQNKKFTVQVSDFVYSPEKEALYNHYHTSVDFSTNPSLKNLLFDNQESSIFSSKEVAIYDGTTLVALGIFDVGETSGEGIVSFFNPNYRKFSMGKYLMLHKILWLKTNGFSYFYPGYFAPNYSKFDYKLNLSENEALSFYDIKTDNWLNISNFNNQETIIKLVKQKTNEMANLLFAEGYPTDYFQYEYFDISMNATYQPYSLLDHPVFLHLLNFGVADIGIVVFNAATSTYQLLVCRKAFDIGVVEQAIGSYRNHLLKPLRKEIEASEGQQFMKELKVYLQKFILV
jgi:leucyl-tRNA---protein transferase